MRSLISIKDANFYDEIRFSVPEASYEEITSISLDFTLHSCLKFSELVAFILLSIVATWVYVRFVTNIAGLESRAS